MRDRPPVCLNIIEYTNKYIIYNVAYGGGEHFFEVNLRGGKHFFIVSLGGG